MPRGRPRKAKEKLPDVEPVKKTPEVTGDDNPQDTVQAQAKAPEAPEVRVGQEGMQIIAEMRLPKGSCYRMSAHGLTTKREFDGALPQSPPFDEAVHHGGGQQVREPRKPGHCLPGRRSFKRIEKGVVAIAAFLILRRLEERLHHRPALGKVPAGVVAGPGQCQGDVMTGAIEVRPEARQQGRTGHLIHLAQQHLWHHLRETDIARSTS